MSATRSPLKRSARGVGLLDALIAMAILAFGMLAMTRFQSRMVTQTTESQSRLVAAQLGDELLSSALVDVNNATCYTRPQLGTCASTRAIARTSEWAGRAASALPGSVTTGAVLGADGRLTVALTWTGRLTAAGETAETRRLEATTDVRP